MKPMGVIYQIELNDVKYNVFIQHDFLNKRSDLEVLDISGILVFNEEFKLVDPKLIDDIEEFMILLQDKG